MSVFVKSGGGENVTPEVTAQTPLVTEILESLVGKVTLANATPETILQGYSAYVGQQLIQGTREDLSRLIDFGSVTLSEPSATITINHGLGVLPKYVVLVAEPGQLYSSDYTWFILQGKTPIMSSNVEIYGWYHGGIGGASNFQAANQFADTTYNSVTFKPYSTTTFQAATFNWVVIA